MDRDWTRGLRVNCYGAKVLYLMHPDRRLDNGGFGVVYQMQIRVSDDDQNQRYYAVKRPKRRNPPSPPLHTSAITGERVSRVPCSTTGGGAEMSKAMQEEAQIILQVPPHENVLDLVDIAHVRGVPVLVTPWGDGGSLSTFLEGQANGEGAGGGGGSGLPVNIPLELAIQLCRGLRHLHDHGVVHYDLKPANIIIFTPESLALQNTSSGRRKRRYVLKVADFGLSRGLKDWLDVGTTLAMTEVERREKFKDYWDARFRPFDFAEHKENDGINSESGGDECGGVGAATRRVNSGTPGYRAPELGMSQSELALCGGCFRDRPMSVPPALDWSTAEIRSPTEITWSAAADANKAVDLWALGLIVGYLANPAMWRSKRGAWVETDRRRKRELLSSTLWREGIAVHCAELRGEARMETEDETGKEGTCSAADDVATTASPLRGMVSDVAVPCLALAAADRPSAADCEAHLCAMYLDHSSSPKQQHVYPAAAEMSRGGKTETDMREARFWSYLFGTPEARNRACELWEALPESDREKRSRLKEYFKIVARCKGSEGWTARAVALLEQMLGMGFWQGARGGEVGAFSFACAEGDDNVAVVRGYLEVLVGLQKMANKTKTVGGTGSPGRGGGGAGSNNCGSSMAAYDGGGGGGTVAGGVGAIRAEIVRRADASNMNRTALHYACREGHLNVANFLIEVGGVDLVMVVDGRNATALHYASQDGQLDVVLYLVSVGGAELVKMVTDTNVTALHWACRNGHLEVAHRLVKAGGTELVWALNNKNSTALHSACLNGHLEVARFLVETGGEELVRAGDDTNCTALHLACMNMHLEVAHLLVAMGGVELVRVADTNNWTALHFACFIGNFEVARILVAAGGAELVAAMDRKWTVLHLACQEGHLEVARLLIEAGGAELIRVAGDMNRTALHLALRNGHLKVARLLVKAGGAELSRARDNKNCTALHLALRKGHLEVACLLVETGGAELARAVNDMNVTALHQACGKGHLEVTRLLVAAGGAELVRAADDKNRTGLFLACQNGHLEAARLLVEAEGGLDSVKVKAYDGKYSPIDMAAVKGHTDIVAMLEDALQ